MLKYDTLRGIFFVFLMLHAMSQLLVTFPRWLINFEFQRTRSSQTQVPVSLKLSFFAPSACSACSIGNHKSDLIFPAKVAPALVLESFAWKRPTRKRNRSTMHDYQWFTQFTSQFFRLEMSSSETIEQTARCRLACCAICFYFLTFSSVEVRKVNDFNLLFTSADTSRLVYFLSTN